MNYIQMFEKQPSKGSQGFQRVADCQPCKDPIGRPLMTVSSLKQASGEARYLDDIPHFEKELYAGLVLSEQAHATFTIDTSELEGMEVWLLIQLLTMNFIRTCFIRELLILSQLLMFLVVM